MDEILEYVLLTIIITITVIVYPNVDQKGIGELVVTLNYQIKTFKPKYETILSLPRNFTSDKKYNVNTAREHPPLTLWETLQFSDDFYPKWYLI